MGFGDELMTDKRASEHAFVLNGVKSCYWGLVGFEVHTVQTLNPFDFNGLYIISPPP